MQILRQLSCWVGSCFSNVHFLHTQKWSMNFRTIRNNFEEGLRVIWTAIYVIHDLHLIALTRPPLTRPVAPPFIVRRCELSQLDMASTPLICSNGRYSRQPCGVRIAKPCWAAVLPVGRIQAKHGLRIFANHRLFRPTTNSNKDAEECAPTV